MIKQTLNLMDQLGLVGHAQAHCDVPCGIYDPSTALVAAVTVVRMIDLMSEEPTGNAVADGNKIARCAIRKEEEVEKVKHEVRIIWGDYFKGELLEKHPNVHSLAHSIMLKGSACKQGVSRDDALALVDLVNEFAELFWLTKGVKTARGKTPYAPNLEIAYAVLS